MNYSIINTICLLAIMFYLIFQIMKIQKDKTKLNADNKVDLRTIKKGDSVVTINGLHGIIDSVNEVENIVCIDCDGVYFDFDSYAIKSATREEDVIGEI